MTRRLKTRTNTGIGTISTYTCYLKRCNQKEHKYRMCKKHYLQLQK